MPYRNNRAAALADGPQVHARGTRREALVKQDALQDAILNCSGFSGIATDEHGIIQIFNVGAERMLGYSADELIDRRSLTDISDPADFVARAAALSAELSTPIEPGFAALVHKAARGVEDVCELTYYRHDGGRLSALLSITALRDARDAVIGFLLISTDNAARQQAEADRQALDRALQEKNAELDNARTVAERANRSKSDFLSNMSHELRSPLNAILGFAQLIDTGEPPPTPPQKSSVDQILQSGWYLLKLINEILDLTMVESGQVSLSLEPMSLAEVLSDCEAMIDPQARQEGIRLSFPTVDSACFVHADRTRVKQVFINLLSNAIKYNRPSGSVTVTCGPGSAGRIRVSFRDTGNGLSPAQLEQLFQPFNRLGQESGSKEGTGIGLVVCERLTRLMAGMIGVQSTVGVGSTFWVELKGTAETQLAAAAEGAAPTPRARGTTDTQARTVLCVEDNPANLMLVQKLIARRPDIEMLSAVNGRDGIDLARARQPAVILMDINLPGMSGLAALRLLAQDTATMHIPVIAVSANAMPRDVAQGLAAGFFRYLTKPIRVDDFMAALDTALDESSLRTNRGQDDGNTG